MNPLFERLGIVLVSVLLMYNIGYSQNNLSIQLTESANLLERLVVCGESDFQKIIIGLDGPNTSARTNMEASLQLFDGIIFDSLVIQESTPSLSLSPQSTSSNPIFILPDMQPGELEEVAIAFTVKAVCGIVEAINANNELQVLDNWQLSYDLEGNRLSEEYLGIEYKNTIAIPNVTIGIAATESATLNVPFSREVKIVNSGLNSYLDEFTYKVTTTAGLEIQALHIGTTEIPFVKTADSQGDSIITAQIDASHFLNNTRESGLLGNQDGRFDVDEIVVMSETIILADCGIEETFELSSTHQVEWGCLGAICQEESSSISINLGIGEEQVQFTVGADSIPVSFCSEGVTSVNISNSGFEFDDGFGTIYDISAGIGFIDGQQFSLLEEGFEITSIQIGDVLIVFPDSVTNLGELDFFLEDPDGEGGLTDADQDGFYDDLPVGEEFRLLANYQLNCSSSAEIDIENGCDNDFRSGFDAKIQYRNSCGGTNEKFFDNYYRSFNSGSTREICSDPDAFNNGDEFTLVYAGERRQSNFTFCDGADEIKATITLPSGILVSTNSFLQQDSLLFPPTIEQDGENWTIVFDAANFDYNRDYNLSIVLTTQCGPNGLISFPFQLEYLCSECDCGQLWYCGVLEGTHLHNTGPPCETVVCEAGISVTSFEVERTTFGFSDTSFTTPIDTAIARKDVALTCDSVQMTVEAVVGQEALEDSIGIVINYGNADESESNAQTFDFDSGVLFVTQMNGTKLSCDLTSEDLLIDTTDGMKQLTIPLGNCIDEVVLTEGDELIFIGQFSINADAPAPTNTFKKIPELRANAFAIIDGKIYNACESYGKLFRIANLETRFSGPNNSSFPNGCESTSMVYSLDKSINANAMREFFGEEQRQATEVDRLVIDYDPNFTEAYSNISIEYRIQDGEWLALPDLLSSNEGTYEADLNNVVSILTASNQLFQLRINVLPECSSAFGSTEGDGSYPISTTLFYTDHYYASFIGDGSCAEQRSVVEDRPIIYQNPPTFSLQGINPDIMASSSEVTWILEHCNTSFNADAGLTWVAFEANDNIEIITVEIVSASGDNEFLLLQEYGEENNKLFALAPALLRNIEGNTNEDICHTYQISAIVNNCGENTLTARTGWNCADFFELDWTPDLYPPCNEQVLELTVTNLDPFLSADYLMESSIISGELCDTSIIDIIVRNEEGGDIFDVNSRITIPNGTKLVPNSFEFAYPSTSAFVPIENDPILLEADPEATFFGATYEYTDFSVLSPFLDANGLPGFNVDAPDSSEFRLKYRLVTDCSFIDGEVNRYRFQGSTGCGEASNIGFAETPPFIFEANTSTSRRFAVELLNQEAVRSGATSLLELSFTNIGDNASDTDSINITVPNTLDYVTNSTQTVSLLDWELDEPLLTRNDNTLQLRYSLPSGLNTGESVTLSFQVMGLEVDCDSGIQIEISTISAENFFCEVSEENCFSNYISSDSTQFELMCSEACVGIDNFVMDTLYVPNCETVVNFCLDNILANDLSQTQVIDNGISTDLSTLLSCDIEQLCIYSYGNILNVGGEIFVDNWVVNGVTFQGAVGTISDLVDSMNVWDPTGNWELNESSVVIEGGTIGSVYSPMDISILEASLTTVLGYDARITPMGLAIPLTVGEHALQIIKPDGCRDSLSILVLEQNCIVECPLPILQSIITEESGCNQSLGSAIISVTGNIEDYDFEWTPDGGVAGITDNIRTELFAGGYRVKVSSKNDSTCFVEQFLIIGNNDGPSVSVEITPSTCIENNGIANFQPDNFTYRWSDGIVASSRNDLRAGIYYVTFTNPVEPGCPNVQLIEIEGENNLQANVIVEEYPNCNETNGAVSLEVLGGSGEYDFNFPSGTNRQDGLAPGIYQVDITDRVSGCELSYSFLLESRITLDTLMITSVSDISCLDNSDGTIAFEAQYSDDFLFPADTIISDGLTDFENGTLPAGDYFIYLRDATGCITSSAPFSISKGDPLQVNVVKSLNCDTTQFIRIEVADTNQTYRYDWLDLPENDDERDRSDLESGIYDLVIFDEQECPTNLSIELPKCCILPTVEEIVTTNSACGKETGSIEIILEQDIEDYTFTMTPTIGEIGSSPNIFENVSAGEYEITVTQKDDSLCSETILAVVEEDSLLMIVTSQIQGATCDNANGMVTLEIVGNDDDFIFTYTPSLGSVGTTPNVQENLPAGSYQVAIQLLGSEQCIQTIEIEVPEESTDDLGASERVIPASCLGNGQIEISVPNSIDDYTYTIEPNVADIGATSNLFINVPPGDYSIEITLGGRENCVQTLAVNVPLNADDELLTNINTTPASCNAPNGTVELQLVDDPLNFSYTFDPSIDNVGSSINIRENLAAGNYSVTITSLTNTSCTQVVDFTIETELVNEFVTDIATTASSCSEINGSVTLTVDGDISDFIFNWQDGVGETGVTPNSREGLGSGSFSVTVTSSSDNTCFEEVLFDIPRDQNGTSPIISDAIRNPSCGESNGSVTLDLVDDPSNYTIEWVPNIGLFGTTQNVRTNLPGGDYQILITDNRDLSCVTSILVALINEEPTAVAISSPPTCINSANGTVRFSPDTYRYSWPDGVVSLERNDLEAGFYEITVTDTTATDICQSVVQVELVADNTLAAAITTNQQPSCDGDDGSATVTVTEGSGSYSYSWGENETNTMLSHGIQMVEVTDVITGCMLTLDFTLEDPNRNGVCADCAINVKKDTIVFQTNNCIEVLPLCFDYQIDNNNPLLFNLDGASVPTTNLSPCDLDSLMVYSYSNISGQGEIGPFEITSWQVNDTIFTGMFADIIELAALMNDLDATNDWQVSEDGLSIIGKQGNTTYQAMQIMGSNSMFNTTLGFETIAQGQGTQIDIPIGMHNLEIRDTQSFCVDSIVILSTCIMIDSTDIRIGTGEMDTICFSTNELLGNDISITIACLQNNTASVEAFGDTCVIITGQNPGVDTACVILCDEFGVCDTNVIAIQLLLEEFEDTLLIREMEEVCIANNILDLEGRFTSITQVMRAENSLPSLVDYDIDPSSGCIQYTAEMLGIDTTFFSFCNEEGSCDTIPFILHILNDPSDRIQDTLFINEEAEYCFDTSIFPGEIVSFENICPESAGSEVDFTLNPLTFCVEYKGLELGQDSACIVICDNLGNCDTAYFNVDVVEFKELPTAIDDRDTTTLGTPVVIDILGNDTPFGVPIIEGITIVELPLYGTANLNLDGSLTYISDEFCARFDQLTYSICNDIGCDTAIVEVWIECIDIVVFTAVSPNRDGVNDVFFISGIEEFPESRLQIYNRWGERVFQTIGYDNDWAGTWKGNLELPDGSYFYCLELNDATNRVIQGFLEIHR